MGLACAVGFVEAWDLELVGIWEVVAVLVVVVVVVGGGVAMVVVKIVQGGIRWDVFTVCCKSRVA